MTLSRHPSPQTSSSIGSAPRLLAAFILAVTMAATAASEPLAAQDDDTTSDKLDDIRAEQEQIDAELAEYARGIDGTLAEISELTTAMAALEQAINKQELALSVAEARLANAERRFAESSEAVAVAEASLVELEIQVRRRAVEAFVGLDVGSPDIVYTSTPNLTVRMQSLLNAVLRGDVDIADAYAAVQEDLAVEREATRLARVQAQEYRRNVEADQRRLESDRAVQEALWIESQARLDHLLVEQQNRQALQIELREDEQREINRLAEQLSRYSGPGGLAGPVATPDEIVWVYGIAIHFSVAENLQAMLEAAQADGITFRGGGYRDSSAQIRLRKAHCGTSEYAIWQAPPSACRPPTARPGSSNHERGLAIDFTDDGRSINNRRSRGYLWLKANAATYGFYNLPSEPWHWSTTGS